MWIALAVLLVALILGALGQISLKSGLVTFGEEPRLAVVLTSMFHNRLVLAGFGCYGLSSLAYLFVLSRLDVSYVYPMVAFNYVLVTFLAWLLLHEAVPWGRVAGLFIVCVGVLVLALNYTPQRSGDIKGEQSRILEDIGDRA